MHPLRGGLTSEKKPSLTPMSISSCLVNCPASLSASITRSANATSGRGRDRLRHGHTPILKLDEFCNHREGRRSSPIRTSRSFWSCRIDLSKWSYAPLSCSSISVARSCKSLRMSRMAPLNFSRAKNQINNRDNRVKLEALGNRTYPPPKCSGLSVGK